MKDAKRIAVVLGMIVVGVILLALQIAAFAGPPSSQPTKSLPAPATEDRRAPSRGAASCTLQSAIMVIDEREDRYAPARN